MRDFLRLLRIVTILIRYRLDALLLSIPALKFFKPLLYLLPWHYLPLTRRPRGERIRLSLECLGPIFIKFGQTLSTRRDLLPDDVGLELSKLQDACPSFAGDVAVKIIEKSLAKKLEHIFTKFDKTPLASASIAQVHSALTLAGDAVVVKVVRPHIKAQIKRDIRLMYRFAKWLNKHPDGRRLSPVGAVSEFERIIYGELDMLNEAANANRLRTNFKHSNLLYVPKIYWDLSRENILVSERIYGTPISDVKTLKAKNINLQQLAENGVIIFFSQVFEHNFFHADMHPGNIFVGDDGKYLGVDFGIMGSLSEADKYYLTESFLGFFNEDYNRVARAHLDSGWVDEEIDLIAFENAISVVCTPLFKKNLNEISFGEVLLSLFKQAKRFNMHIQPQLLLLDKTLLNIEGLGRALYPNLDLWTTAKPFLEKLAKQKYQPRTLFRAFKARAPRVVRGTA